MGSPNEEIELFVLERTFRQTQQKLGGSRPISLLKQGIDLQDRGIGNVVGSNIFNILGVLGIASVVAPTGIRVPPAVTGFDIPVMIAVAFACLPIFYTGGVISRPEGALFLGYYVAYTLYLIMAASYHDALPNFNAAMLYFVIPLTLVTLVITALRERHGRKRPPKHNP